MVNLLKLYHNTADISIPKIFFILYTSLFSDEIKFVTSYFNHFDTCKFIYKNKPYTKYDLLKTLLSSENFDYYAPMN